MSFDEEEKSKYRMAFIKELDTMQSLEIMELINIIIWVHTIEIFRSIIYDNLYHRLLKNHFRIMPAQYVELAANEFVDGYVQSSELSEEIRETMWEGIIDGNTKFQTADSDISNLITALQILND